MFTELGTRESRYDGDKRLRLPIMYNADGWKDNSNDEQGEGREQGKNEFVILGKKGTNSFGFSFGEKQETIEMLGKNQVLMIFKKLGAIQSTIKDQ